MLLLSKSGTCNEGGKENQSLEADSDKIQNDMSCPSSITSSKTDVCHISGKQLDQSSSMRLEASLAHSSQRSNIRGPGLMSVQKNNKVRPFEFRSQSVQDDGPWKRIFGKPAPQNVIGVQVKQKRSPHFNFRTRERERRLLTRSNGYKAAGNMESTDSNNSQKQDPVYSSFISKYNKVNNKGRLWKQ